MKRQNSQNTMKSLISTINQAFQTFREEKMKPALLIVIVCLLVGGIKFVVDMLDAKKRINKTAKTISYFLDFRKTLISKLLNIVNSVQCCHPAASSCLALQRLIEQEAKLNDEILSNENKITSELLKFTTHISSMPQYSLNPELQSLLSALLDSQTQLGRACKEYNLACSLFNHHLKIMPACLQRHLKLTYADHFYLNLSG